MPDLSHIEDGFAIPRRSALLLWASGNSTAVGSIDESGQPPEEACRAKRSIDKSGRRELNHATARLVARCSATELRPQNAKSGTGGIPSHRSRLVCWPLKASSKRGYVNWTIRKKSEAVPDKR